MLDEVEIEDVQHAAENEETLKRLMEIDASVSRRYIEGKFSGPVTLHGQQVLDAGYNLDRTIDYIFVGFPNAPASNAYSAESKAIMRGLDPQFQFTALGDLARAGMRLEGRPSALQRELAESHVLAYQLDRNNPKQVNLCLIYPYDFTDHVGRPALDMKVYLTIPLEQLYALLEVVESDPDALEQFYQVSTDGLGQSVKRFKASQMAVVNVDTFIPLYKFLRPSDPPHRLIMQVPPLQNRLNLKGLEVLPYSSPHGEVDRLPSA